MKKFMVAFLLFILAVPVLVLAQGTTGVAVESKGNTVTTATVFVTKDTQPKWGDASFKSYVQADKDARAAHADGDFALQAEKTPFAWVAAWAWFNDGRQLAKAGSFDAAELSFAKSEALIDLAEKSGLAPVNEDSPNTMDKLKKVLASYRKWIADQGTDSN